MRTLKLFLTASMITACGTTLVSQTLGAGSQNWEALNQRYGKDGSDLRHLKRLGVTSAQFDKCKSGGGRRNGQSRDAGQRPQGGRPSGNGDNQRGDMLFACLRQSNPNLSRAAFDATIKEMRSQF